MTEVIDARARVYSAGVGCRSHGERERLVQSGMQAPSFREKCQWPDADIARVTHVGMISMLIM